MIEFLIGLFCAIFVSAIIVYGSLAFVFRKELKQVWKERNEKRI